MIRLLGIACIALGWLGVRQSSVDGIAPLIMMAGGAIMLAMGNPRRWDWIGRALVWALVAVSLWILWELLKAGAL